MSKHVSTYKAVALGGLLGLSTLLAPTMASAADYAFDKAHTQILFRVSHLGFSTSTGFFTDFDGSFSYNPDAPETSSVTVTIPVDSLEMHDAEWNEHLRDEKWFNVAKYPDMTFKSTAVTKTGENTLEITGDLTLLGQTHPVTLKTVVNKVGDQMGTAKAGFSVSATIDRTAWGMTTYAPVVGADIDIMIEVEGVKQ
ncbi:YceI family protein [Parahaliea mediterranea]|uniref:YceI family protein n=1 Tax=Parahaliea mediterranea TaxID=651086 RepID=UPI000E2FB4BF|nr:YceI family protein [Parahaliea mediterranea]